MELINSREKYLRYLNEIKLGLIKTDEEKGLLSELFASTSDPGFKEKEEKYIKYPFLKQRYEGLQDKGKATAINKIDLVVNGANLGNPVYSQSLKTMDWLVANALAAYAVTGASPAEKTSIINFLTYYYNPYPTYSSGKAFSDAGYKALPKNVDMKAWPYDVLMDFISISYYNAMNYLLKDEAYNPSPDNVFDAMLFQFTWKQRFKNEMKDYLNRRGEVEDDYSEESNITKGATTSQDYFSDKEEEDEFKSKQGMTGDETSSEEPGYKDTYASRKKGLSNDEKIAYLGSKLGKTDQTYLNTWYKWYKMNSGQNGQEAKEKIVDSLTSGSEGALDVFAPKNNSDESKKLYDFVTKEMNLSPLKDNNAARSGMSRMKEKMEAFINDPEFIQKMGISGFQKSKITRKSLLKGTQKMKGGDMDESQMFEFIAEANNFFNSDFTSNRKMLDKIQKFNKLANETGLNESYDVEVKDLDQEIIGYLKYITESLYETGNILNELYKVHEGIKFEYPEVSDKIAELIPPVSEEVSRLIDKVNEVKKQMKPVLYNLDESKKKVEGELEEERLTNPDTKEFVKKRQNFIGSHIYGEDLGGLGQMYVSYSYGEQFPAYLWHKDKWYHNSDDYTLDDGSVNEPTIQHKKDMRPSQDTHGMSTYALNSMIRKFKSKHGLGDNVHTDVEPGEKN
jgi:hypothetical protein